MRSEPTGNYGCAVVIRLVVCVCFFFCPGFRSSSKATTKKVTRILGSLAYGLHQPVSPSVCQSVELANSGKHRGRRVALSSSSSSFRDPPPACGLRAASSRSLALLVENLDSLLLSPIFRQTNAEKGARPLAHPIMDTRSSCPLSDCPSDPSSQTVSPTVRKTVVSNSPLQRALFCL